MQTGCDSTGIAVAVKNLSKCYRIFDKPKDRLLQAFVRRKLYREFWALRDVSFELGMGETVGVVGRNGSGKSTLLQLICGTLAPTSGEIVTRGRIAALLELGSGFNPDFTGRENVFLNAALLGLNSRQTEERLPEILAFAGIGDFIDQPVKCYSSGMAVRLAFAVQAHTDPQILIVDEALAVGDEMFQKKCHQHIKSLKNKGTSILLVTHSCPQIISQCDRAIALREGRLMVEGLPKKVTILYQRLINASEAEWIETISQETLENPQNEQANSKLSSGEETTNEPNGHETQDPTWLDEKLTPSTTMVFPSEGARIEDILVLDSKGKTVNTLPHGSDFTLRIQYYSDEELTDITFGCLLSAVDGSKVSGQSFPEQGRAVASVGSERAWFIDYHFRGGLWPGVYFISAGIYQPWERETAIHRVSDYKAIRIYATSRINRVGAADLSVNRPTTNSISFELSSPS